MVTDAGNQGQLPWLATLVTKVTTMVTMMVTMMVTTMVTITNLGYRGCITDYCVKLLNLNEKQNEIKRFIARVYLHRVEK